MRRIRLYAFMHLLKAVTSAFGKHEPAFNAVIRKLFIEELRRI